MSVEHLRNQISEEADRLLPQALVEVGLQAHTKRKGHWQSCSCEWCSTKREATAVIANHWPRGRGHYVEDLRDCWRELRRKEYREKLNRLKEK